MSIITKYKKQKMFVVKVSFIKLANYCPYGGSCARGHLVRSMQCCKPESIFVTPHLDVSISFV